MEKDIQEIVDYSFKMVRQEMDYDLESELRKPLLSKVRHEFKGIIGLYKTFFSLYEKLIQAHRDKDQMENVYRMIIQSFLRGKEDFNDPESSFGIYFNLREFHEDENKKIAVAHFFNYFFSYAENHIDKLSGKDLKIMLGKKTDIINYYDTNALFDLFRKVPLEILGENGGTGLPRI